MMNSIFHKETKWWNSQLIQPNSIRWASVAATATDLQKCLQRQLENHKQLWKMISKTAILLHSFISCLCAMFYAFLFLSVEQFFWFSLHFPLNNREISLFISS